MMIANFEEIFYSFFFLVPGITSYFKEVLLKISSKHAYHRVSFNSKFITETAARVIFILKYIWYTIVFGYMLKIIRDII